MVTFSPDYGRRAVQVDARTRRLLAARSQGVCEACGVRPAVNVQHRQPRGMGGTRRMASKSLANLLHVCGSGTTGCHGLMESRREWARTQGFLVPSWADPVNVRVCYRGRWVWLTADGKVSGAAVEGEAAAAPEQDNGDAA